MYLVDNFVDLGLANINKKLKWTSKTHRRVAINCCIGNPRIFTMETLVQNIRIINSISRKEIKKVTWSDLIRMGCAL